MYVYIYIYTHTIHVYSTRLARDTRCNAMSHLTAAGCTNHNHYDTDSNTVTTITVNTDTAGVCETNTPPDKNAIGEITQTNTKSVAGKKMLLLFCRAVARVKGVFFSHTPVLQ